MPNDIKHLEKVRHNKEMLKYLGKPEDTKFPDWFVTVTFYIAVHCIEAIFYHEKKDHSKHHIDRDDKLLHKYRDIDMGLKRAYWRLHEQSQEARYMENSKFKLDKDDCNDATINLDIVEKECKENYFPNYPNI